MILHTQPSIQLYTGDALSVLQQLAPASVHCVVTSPPYWGLRDYGTASWSGGDADCNHKCHRGSQGPSGIRASRSFTQPNIYKEQCAKCGAVRGADLQFGLEPSFEEYIFKLVGLFRELRRVLRDDGTLWLNMGDSYVSTGGHSDTKSPDRRGQYRIGTRPDNGNRSVRVRAGKDKDPKRGSAAAGQTYRVARGSGLKSKDMAGIPWRLALALQADGWYLRQDIIWHKPNPMPESVADRCTKSHEYVFLLSKSEQYHCDMEAIVERVAGTANTHGDGVNPKARENHGKQNESFSGSVNDLVEYRNKRSVWTVPTQPFEEAHFATFPEDLIRPCILAGCPSQSCAKCGAPFARILERGGGTIGKSWNSHEADGVRGNRIEHQERHHGRNGSEPYFRKTVGFRPSCQCKAGSIPGVVLDPFFGSGTTGLVARANGCNTIGIELSPEYVSIALQRLRQEVLPWGTHSTVSGPGRA